MTTARKALAAAESEADFQTWVVDLLKLYGWHYYHPWRSDHSVKGFPDITAVRGSRLLFAELKSMKGMATDDQVIWIEALDHSVIGVEVYLWRPSDRDAIEEILKRR